jgi:hypothetical protein
MDFGMNSAPAPFLREEIDGLLISSSRHFETFPTTQIWHSKPAWFESFGLGYLRQRHNSAAALAASRGVRAAEEMLSKGGCDGPVRDEHRGRWGPEHDRL